MNQPLIIPLRHRDREVYQNFESWQFTHAGRTFNVEEGFIADGASVPRLLWPWMPPDGLHRAAALAHDRVFAGGHKIGDYRFTLWEADLMFLRLMIEGGVSPTRAKLTWLALKTGSWYPWKASQNRTPEILPVRNAAPSHEISTTRFKRHLYTTILTP